MRKLTVLFISLCLLFTFVSTASAKWPHTWDSSREANGPFTISQNSDTFVMSGDGTDWYQKWSDGELYLISDEGINPNSTVWIDGKGTGYGVLKVNDNNGNKGISIYSDAGVAQFAAYGDITEYVFNDVGSDVDFRVESDTLTHALFVDGATGEVTGNRIATNNQYKEIGLHMPVLDIVTLVGVTGTGADSATELGYESGAGRTWTYHGGLTTDKIFKGETYVYSFDGVDSYLSTPDAADMSFDDNGDNKVSMGGWIEVVAGATVQTILSKWDETTSTELREWRFYLTSGETLAFAIYDESENVQCYRGGSVAVSEGWHFVVMTYDSSGGANAANGITLYVDGVVETSTATNDGSYVGMEDSTTLPMVGAKTGAVAMADFFAGDMGRIWVAEEELDAGSIWMLYSLTRGFYGE